MPWSVQILPVKEYTEIAAAALGFTKENGLKLLCLQKKEKAHLADLASFNFSGVWVQHLNVFKVLQTPPKLNSGKFGSLLVTTKTWTQGWMFHSILSFKLRDPDQALPNMEETAQSGSSAQTKKLEPFNLHR